MYKTRIIVYIIDIDREASGSTFAGSDHLPLPQPNKGSKSMVAQIQTAITTEIISTYTSDFDGLQIDTIQMTYPDGTTETRYGWTEEDFTTGEVTYYLRAKTGAVLSSNWKTTKNNKWLVAYRYLDTKRHQANVAAHNAALEIVAAPEFFSHDEYLKAKADLGF